MKKLIIITITVCAFLMFAANSYAAKDSMTTTLHLTILPAFESIELNDQTDNNPLFLTKTKTLGVRSNTSWNIEVLPYNWGFVNAPYCFTEGNIGLSNGDANVGNNYQQILITCVQAKSWGDLPNAILEINYAAGVSL